MTIGFIVHEIALAATRPVQFGLGAAGVTALVLASDRARSVAFVGTVAAVAAAAFTLVAETFGPITVLAAIGTVAKFAIITVVGYFTVVTVYSLIFMLYLRAMIESVTWRRF